LNVLSFSCLIFFFVFYYVFEKKIHHVLYNISVFPLASITCLLWWFIYSMESLLHFHVHL
jgi:hypothetical protein